MGEVIKNIIFLQKTFTNKTGSTAFFDTKIEKLLLLRGRYTYELPFNQIISDIIKKIRENPPPSGVKKLTLFEINKEMDDIINNIIKEKKIEDDVKTHISKNIKLMIDIYNETIEINEKISKIDPDNIIKYISSLVS